MKTLGKMKTGFPNFLQHNFCGIMEYTGFRGLEDWKACSSFMTCSGRLYDWNGMNVLFEKCVLKTQRIGAKELLKDQWCTILYDNISSRLEDLKRCTFPQTNTALSLVIIFVQSFRSYIFLFRRRVIHICRWLSAMHPGPSVWPW